jgi:hypothetical protein
VDHGIISSFNNKRKKYMSELKLFIISEHWQDTDAIKEAYKDNLMVQEAIVIGDAKPLEGLQVGTFEVWDLRKLSVALAKLKVEPFVMFVEED